MTARLTRRHAAAALFSAAAAISPARAQRARYSFDQGVGNLGFSARHLGMFASHGKFDRFHADLALDPALPAQADVDVVIETGFVTLPWPGATDLLRGPRYFDVERFPQARFTGRAEGVADQGAFPVRGVITLRGIERPLLLRARLEERQREPSGDIARFTAEGEIRRSEFGMTADRTMISDVITLTVEVRIRV
jgi:polyisoprenoid-binding protein YceI